MRHLFLPDLDLGTETVQIDGGDYHHLAHVLRARPGDSLVVLDNAGLARRAEILAVDRRTVTLRLREPVPTAPEPPISLTVAQALGKGDRFEQVVQHATEIGACAFVPLVTERAVLRLEARAAEARRRRWHLIVKGAAEQAGRARIPSVEPVTALTTLTARFAHFASVLLLHPGGERLSETLRGLALRRSSGGAGIQGSSLLLLVGPEGGFSPKEVATVQAAGGRAVSLGPYTLRTETAALVAVSQILYYAGCAALGGRCSE